MLFRRKKPSKPSKSHVIVTLYPGTKQIRRTYEIDINTRIRNGFYRTYHPNGSIKTSATYRDGMLHGAYTKYYSNQNKRMDGTYHRGRKHEIFRHWHRNGQRSIECCYDFGKQRSFECHWDKFGSMTKETNWSRYDHETKYYNDGVIVKVVHYNHNY